MTFSEASRIACDRTRTVSGRVITPGDARWDEARRPFDAAAPANIAVAGRYASRHRVQVAVQPIKRRRVPADVLHTAFPHHLTAAGTEVVKARRW